MLKNREFYYTISTYCVLWVIYMSDIDNKNFGRRLRELRKSKGLNADQFAEKVGISTHFVREMESGRKLPSVSVLIKIVNDLDISADLLLRDYVNRADDAVIKELSQRLSGLNAEQLSMITDVIDVILKHQNK